MNKRLVCFILKKKVFSDQLPEVGLGQLDDENVQNESIHIYANKQNPHYEDYQMAKVKKLPSMCICCVIMFSFIQSNALYDASHCKQI